MYRIHSQNLTEWELIKPKGKISDLYITGHSMVHYQEQQSLLLFGGFRTDVGRFAQLSGEKENIVSAILFCFPTHTYLSNMTPCIPHKFLELTSTYNILQG